MHSSQSGAGSYVDYGYSDDGPLSHAEFVFPAVLSLAGKVGNDCRVLDIGCGNGLLSGLFLSHGCQVVGVDLSEQGIAIARARYPAARFELMPADERVLERLDEPPFDLVVSTEVIEHLYDPAGFLEGCYGALLPGGRLIMSTPYHGYWKNLVIAAIGKFDRHAQAQLKGGHIKFWSRATIEQAMHREGFRDFDFRGVGRIPLLWKSMVVAGSRPLV
jgi:SAM-dependent methyltransferase